jgi:hypothetical protein
VKEETQRKMTRLLRLQLYQFAVGFWSAVAEELPRSADFVYHVQIKVCHK